MAVRRVRLRRGTTAENNAYTGVIGEVTVDTEKENLTRSRWHSRRRISSSFRFEQQCFHRNRH